MGERERLSKSIDPDDDQNLFLDPGQLDQIKRDKEACPDFDHKGQCYFYLDKCFHSFWNRCFRAVPRTEGEMMEWMGAICSDCNEVICNPCEVYLNYFAPIEVVFSEDFLNKSRRK